MTDTQLRQHATLSAQADTDTPPYGNGTRGARLATLSAQAETDTRGSPGPAGLARAGLR